MGRTAAGQQAGWTEARRRAVLRRELAVAVAVLLAANVVVELVHPRGAAAVAWSVLPLAGALGLVLVQWRAYRRSDEFAQRLQLMAFAIGFAVTVLIAFVGGSLESAGVGSGRWWLQATFIGGVLSSIVALYAVGWRDR